MTRLISGTAGGRRLLVPKHGTRPTSDRVRESLFSSLDHRLGSWHGLRVLDLFAGSGALGLEARSRGAVHATLVDSGRDAVRVCRENVELIGLTADVVGSDVMRYVARPADSRFDVVFADPPYDLPATWLENMLDNLAANGWLARDAVVILERAAADSQIAWPRGFVEDGERRLGDTVLRFAHWTDLDTD
ncbi:MAG: 16S rRNA (guanine(966)-N(2))-methyltransferase RsmD [Candidatus Nanopelagicales bacterium]